MKRFVPILMMLTLETISAQQARPRSLAEVQGVVVRIATDEKLADVTVELTGIVERRTDSFRAGSVFALRAKTDQMGRFRIENVPPGSSYHLVAVRLPDYLPAQYGQRHPALPGSPFDLTPGELKELRVEMTPAASISGRVLESRGKAIQTEIQAIRPSYWDGYRILSETPLEYVKNNISRTTSSDRDGRFRLEGLAPGQLYIYATPGSSVGTASAYFPNVLDAVEATPLDVRPGQVITDIDITLERSAKRKISGMVIPDSTGTIIRSVEAIPVRVNQMRESFLVPYTEKGNRFEVLIYFRGRYNLFLQAMDTNGKSWWGRTTVDVKDDDIKDLQVSVIPSFDISGRVSVDASSSSAGRLDMGSITLDLHQTSSGTRYVPGVRVKTDGSFTFTDVTPGDYRIDVAPILSVPPVMSAAPLQNAFVQSIHLDDLDVLNSGLRLLSKPPENGSGLQVVISLRGGVLDGRVVNEKREPIPNIRAVLVPDSARRFRRDLYRSAFTNDSGLFQIRGIPPGDYKVFSWESVEEGAWQDAAFIRLFEDRGEALHIEADGVESVTAVVIPPWK